MGFYNSIHDSNLDNALEYSYSDSCGNPIASLVEKAFDCVDWSKVHEDYAEKYTELLADKFNIEIEFESLQSPKYYNYSTDRIFCHITKKEINRIYKLVDKAELSKLIKDTFTSCDGFCSHYANDLAKWGKISQWDFNQIGTLIQAYINQESNSDDWEWYLMEDAELINLIDKHTKDADKLCKLVNYIVTRQERHV